MQPCCSCPLTICSHTLLSFLGASGTTISAGSWGGTASSWGSLSGEHATWRLATERMLGGSVCAALLCRSCWIGRLLHRSARAACTRRRQRADTLLCPSLSLSLSRSFPLSLLRRLLSAACESVAMRDTASASALLAVAAARLLFRILAREGGGTFEREMRVDTGIRRDGVRIRVCVYVRRCPSRCSSRPPCIRTRLFSNRQFALLQYIYIYIYIYKNSKNGSTGYFMHTCKMQEHLQSTHN